jgi:hypothetical protein
MKTKQSPGSAALSKTISLISLLFLSIMLFTGCGGNKHKQMATERLEKVIAIKSEVIEKENAFLHGLDSMNLNRGDSSFAQADHEMAVSLVTTLFNGFTQGIFDGLGKAAALANNEPCPSVDALSEYLLGMKNLAETNYSEMMRLSALPLQGFSTADSAAYAMAVSRAERQRENLERALNFEVQRFAKEHGVELRKD